MKRASRFSGEQIAQVTNPDPFAIPVWRSPVYRTSVLVIVCVQAARLAGKLFRLVRHHPVLTLTTALVWWLWRRFGWPAPVVLASVLVTTAGLWRWLWPASFSRLVLRPAYGRWRRGRYQRHWAAVMTIGRLAPAYQGRLLLPVLGKVASTRYTDRVAIRLVSGQSAEDYARRADNLAHGFGAVTCRVRSARPGRLVLEFVRRDALTAIIPALPIPARPGPDRAAGRPPRGRQPLDHPPARHAPADRRVHRRGQGLGGLGPDPRPAPGPARRPGPGPGRRPEGDGAGLRPGRSSTPTALTPPTQSRSPPCSNPLSRRCATGLRSSPEPSGRTHPRPGTRSW